jgi:hypothetical protein
MKTFFYWPISPFSPAIIDFSTYPKHVNRPFVPLTRLNLYRCFNLNLYHDPSIKKGCPISVSPPRPYHHIVLWGLTLLFRASLITYPFIISAKLHSILNGSPTSHTLRSEWSIRNAIRSFSPISIQAYLCAHQ